MPQIDFYRCRKEDCIRLSRWPLYNLIMQVNLQPVLRFFWDFDVSALSWEEHQNLIIRRLLGYGDLAAMRWLRAQMGDDLLRTWIVKRRARGLSPRQIRYWSLILDIDTAQADEWVKTAADSPWERRS